MYYGHEYRHDLSIIVYQWPSTVTTNIGIHGGFQSIDRGIPKSSRSTSSKKQCFGDPYKKLTCSWNAKNVAIEVVATIMNKYISNTTPMYFHGFSQGHLDHVLPSPCSPRGFRTEASPKSLGLLCARPHGLYQLLCGDCLDGRRVIGLVGSWNQGTWEFDHERKDGDTWCNQRTCSERKRIQKMWFNWISTGNVLGYVG